MIPSTFCEGVTVFADDLDTEGIHPAQQRYTQCRNQAGSSGCIAGTRRRRGVSTPRRLPAADEVATDEKRRSERLSPRHAHVDQCAVTIEDGAAQDVRHNLRPRSVAVHSAFDATHCERIEPELVREDVDVVG
jgi:hypothetical protein